MTLAARITFVVLVAATFAAFFVAQRLKGAPPVVSIRGTVRWFSPNGDGRRDTESITVRLKSSDDVTVEMVDAGGDPVRHLADGVHVRAGVPLRLRWDGRTDAGTRAPDGTYHVRVALRRQGRSVTRKTIILDTRPPRPVVTGLAPGNVVGAPPGRVQVSLRGVSGRFPTQVRVLRTDQGRPRQVAAFRVRRGARTGTWDGLAGGVPAPPGTYLMQVSVRDRAGNVGTTPMRVAAGAVPGSPGLTVRGLAAQPPLRPVTEGGRVQLLVDARHRAFRWRVRRIGTGHVVARGRGRPGQRTLSFTAPSGPSGAYLADIGSGRWRTRVPVLVQSARRAPILVVVPAITWLGSDPVDDPPFDGVPDTLAAGDPVRWPRVFAGDGLPTGFAQDVAPLLVFLDRAGVRYDLTSDLDLALSGSNPRATDRAGVLLAGSERWIPEALARRLRRYVLDGGRLASFGTGSLRRMVTLVAAADEATGSLVRPTQPSAQDPFGARLRPLRATSPPATLSLIDGDPSFGLLTGVVDLGPFDALEESAPVTGPHERLLAAVGQQLTDAEAAAAARANRRPREPLGALTAVRLGKGLVIRVGVPEWPARLHDPGVAQVTRNIADLLRGTTPQVGTR